MTALHQAGLPCEAMLYEDGLSQDTLNARQRAVSRPWPFSYISNCISANEKGHVHVELCM